MPSRPSCDCNDMRKTGGYKIRPYICEERQRILAYLSFGMSTE
jgi:hypothetical protein